MRNRMPLLRFRGLASFHRSCLLRRFSNLARCFERSCYASLVRRFHQRFPPSTFPIHRPNRSPKSFLRIYIPETYIHTYIHIYIYKATTTKENLFHPPYIIDIFVSPFHHSPRTTVTGSLLFTGISFLFFPPQKVVSPRVHTHARTHTHALAWRT